METKILRLFFILLFLGVTQISLFSQGILKGKVRDKNADFPLVAATVTLSGTTVGTVTDQNGEYVLTYKPGNYTVNVSYIGYESFEQEITLVQHQTIVLDIALGTQAIQGEEAVITVQARGQLAAVNQQLRANQIINVVSAEKIRELPDENAAQAVSRLPGVHLDGSKVVIRGIEPKMNKILINGVDMPSTEQDDRATDLGMISANMLSGIEVVKTLTPDMDADAVGGVVNLRVREAQSGLHYSLTSQGGYNQQEKYMGNIKFWGDISNRFFEDKLGILLNLNYEKRNSGNDRYTLAYDDEANSTTFWGGDYIYSGINTYDDFDTRNNIGGSLVLDYDLSKGQIVYSGMFTHRHSDEMEYRDSRTWSGSAANYWQLHFNRANYDRLLMNQSLRYEQQIGIVRVDAGVSNVILDHDDNFRYRYRWSQETVTTFIEDSAKIANVRNAGTWDFYDWMNPEASSYLLGHDCNYTPQLFDEKQWLADFNVAIPVRITDGINMEVKFGGKYKRKERHYDETGLGYGTDNFNAVHQSVADFLTNTVGHEPLNSTFDLSDWRDFDYEPNEGYMNNEGARVEYATNVDLMDEMWTEQVDMNPETTPMLLTQDMARNDYWGFETQKAGYVMAEINLGKRLTIIPGVRIENVHNEYSAKKVEYRTMSYWFNHDTLTRPADHTNVLPHLHLRLKATDWWDIRFSYNNTLTRPDYTYAIPSIYYNTSTGDGVAGNPYIKPATSENIDGNFTFYSRKLGLLTLGGFYKSLKDVFYMQETVLSNIPDSSIIAEFPTEQYSALKTGLTNFYMNSPYTATIYGLEFEWQSNFNWLPGAWKGLVLNANYTHVWSETKYMLHRVLFVVPPGGWLAEPVESDTFYTNRLMLQADDIANLSVGYDYKGFSTRLSFRYQGNVVSSVASLPQLNEYTEPEYKFDLAVKQAFGTKYGDLEVFANAINFTNVPYGRYIDYPTQAGGETVIKRKTTYKRYTGRQFQLGIRFRY